MSSPLLCQVLDAKSFEDIFTSLVDAKRRYRELAMAVHPDHGGSADALAKLTQLHQEMLAQAALTGWMERGKLTFRCTDGKTRSVRYRHSHAAGPGRAYQGAAILTFVLPNEHADLVEQACKIIGTQRFPTSAMQEKLTKAGAPTMLGAFHASDAPVVALVLRAAPDLVRLDHLLAHQGGRLPAPQVAWMITRMLNLCCWLQWQRRVHHAISLDSLYVAPAAHDLHLLGGWWHCVDEGSQMPLRLPAGAVAELPRLVRETKVATCQTDLRLARRVARELLGDATGTSFAARKDIPRPLATWLLGPPAADAFKDFADWEKVRENSFGERKFVKLDVTADDIYPTNRR